jgi:hypothetical protein
MLVVNNISLEISDIKKTKQKNPKTTTFFATIQFSGIQKFYYQTHILHNPKLRKSI